MKKKEEKEERTGRLKEERYEKGVGSHDGKN
jgi:hypothetical protein